MKLYCGVVSEAGGDGVVLWKLCDIGWEWEILGWGGEIESVVTVEIVILIDDISARGEDLVDIVLLVLLLLRTGEGDTTLPFGVLDAQDDALITETLHFA